MTDEAYLKLILDGQKETQRKVDGLVTVVAKLEQRVDGWEKKSDAADEVHDKCRAEVDAKIALHADEDNRAHGELDKRIAPIEQLHLQQAGGAKTAALFWKVLTGALGLTLVILGILGYTGVFS